MKSIANQYRDLKEGRMSQANFMRNLRMNMPQYITNVTSFNDAIRILKSKSILTESHLGNDQWFDAFQDAIEGMELSPENHKRVIDSLDHVDPLAKYGDMKPNSAAKEFVDHVLNANKEAKEDDTAEIEAMLAQAEEEESGKHTKFQDVPGAISEQQPGAKEIEQAIKDEKIDPAVVKAAAEKAMKGDSTELATLIINASAGKLREAKNKKELHPNQIHPQELRMGIRVELEHTDDLDKAKKIALDHLAENPFYYTALKLSGIESPSKPKEKPVKEKKAKKSDKIELVDLVNGMKKVKMPKAEEKKKLKEARFNISGEPNAAAEQAMKFVEGNATLKALSNDIEIQQSQDDAILRYDYWKPLPPEAVEKLKLQFNVELIEDFDEDTGNIIAYRLTPLRGKAEKYRAFQSKLEALVKEVMAEYYFDGRDNLVDPIAAKEKQ